MNGLLINYKLCSGCESCVVACKEEHGYPVGRWGIKVYKDGPWGKKDGAEYGSDFNWNNVPVPTDLCDLCADRVARGRKPTCVHHCLADVMRYGTVEELALELAKNPGQVLWVPEYAPAVDDVEAENVAKAERSFCTEGSAE